MAWFREWCTKIQRRANEAKAAAKSTQAPLNNVANDFCKRIWCDLLTNVLTPDQREHDKFQIRRNSRTDEITFRKGQRSWVHSKLRERLGDAKVAYYIFHHGIPDILNMDIMSSLEESGVPGDETLLALLDELLRWQSAMLSSLVDHKNHFQEQRARDKAESIKTYFMGKALAAERINRERYPFSMTNSELNALSQYESGKARKNLDVISQRPRLHLTPKIGEHKKQQEERQLSAHSLQRRRKTYIDDVHIVRPHKQYYTDTRPIATKHDC